MVKNNKEKLKRGIRNIKKHQFKKREEKPKQTQQTF